MTSKRRQNRAIAFAIVFCLVALPIAVAATLALLGSRALNQLTPAEKPILVQPTDAPVDLGLQGVLTPNYGKAESIASNGASGLITEVGLHEGQAVKNGDIAFRANGVGVVAYVSGTTFFRPLSWGDTGSDVEALQNVLNSLPIDVAIDADGYYGRATYNAVWALEEYAGVEKPTGKFSPQLVLRVPFEGFTPVTVSVSQGTQAPPLGGSVAEAAPRIESVSISPTPARSDGKFVFVGDGKRIELTAAAGAWAPLSLEVAIDLFAGKTASGPDAKIQPIQGRIALETPEAGRAIPASSIIRGEAGTTCVLVSKSAEAVGSERAASSKAPRDPADFSPVTVSILGNTISGAALISDEVPDGAMVVANPSWAGKVSCP